MNCEIYDLRLSIFDLKTNVSFTDVALKAATNSARNWQSNI